MERAHNILSTFLNGRHSTLYVLLWSFVLAILVSSFVYISPLVAVLIFIIALGIYGVEKIYYGDVSRAVFLFIFILVSFAFGSLRYAIKDFHEPHVPTYTGVVVSEPEHKDASVRFVFEADNGERVLVSTDRLSEVAYGDNIVVEGVFKTPGVIVDEVSGREFDYGKYLSKDDIYYTSSFARVTILKTGEGSKLLSALLTLKHSFVAKIKSILPEPEASLLAGLIVAGKEALPGNVLDDFKRAGVVHIVVLSGYNVTIIAEFFLLVLGFLGTRRAALFSALGIILFTLMTGATATVVRAAIMVVALLFGRIIKRWYHPGRILLFTACLMLVWNPKDLVFNPSFQLSFLAMFALVYIVPLVKSLAEKRVPAQPILSGLAEVVYITVATQITALPFLLYSVGSVSLVSLVSNILILFVVPLTMLVGFIAVMLAFISTILAWPFAFATHLLLKYILFIAHFLGNLSWANVQTSHLSWWLVLVLYLFLISIVVRLRSLLPQSAS